VGTQKVRRKVVGSTVLSGNGTRQAVNGTHPPSCRCGPCFMAKKQELAAHLATVRDACPGSGARVAVALPSRTGESAHSDDFVTLGKSRWELRTAADIARLARTVEATCVAQAHQVNKRSPRSHCLVKLYLTQHADSNVATRHLLFVDLAESGRILGTGVEGTERLQAASINSSSLLCAWPLSECDDPPVPVDSRSAGSPGALIYDYQ
jgi:hypothetical protein